MNPGIGHENKGLYEFGAFRLDPAERVLRRDGERISLAPKAFDTLLILVQHSGHVLSKDQLLKSLWPDSFVEENNLTQQISQVRRALSDGMDGQSYIETVPKLGYRFLPEVRQLGNGDPPTPLGTAGELIVSKRTHMRIVLREEEEEEEIDGSPDSVLVTSPRNEPSLPKQQKALIHDATSSEIESKKSVRNWRFVLLAPLVLLLAAAGYYGLRQSYVTRIPALFGVKGGAANPARIRSLVVLPLKNLSGDAGQDYFVDAMTDALTTDMAQIHDLRVISGTSAMHYKDTRKTLPEIARELNVEGAVEGSIYRSGDSLRITAQLVQADGDQHLWARSYERDLRNVLALQNEVAKDIASEIKIKLTPQEEQRLNYAPPIDSEAYQLYLQAGLYTNRFTEDYFRKAVSTYEQSIARDPNFAPAYVGLATVRADLATFGYDPPAAASREIKEDLKKALELDEQSAAAHATLSDILMKEWDWAAARRELQRALELDSNDSVVHASKANYLFIMSRYAEAIEEMQRSKSLDPVNLGTSLTFASFYLVAGKLEQANIEYRKTLELDPNYVPAHAELAFSLTKLGKREEARIEYEKSRELLSSRQSLVMDEWMAPVEIFLGKEALAKNNLDWWDSKKSPGYKDAFILAGFYAEMGNNEKACQFLKEAYQKRLFNIVGLKSEVNFTKDFRATSCYRDIVRQMNFPE